MPINPTTTPDRSRSWHYQQAHRVEGRCGCGLPRDNPALRKCERCRAVGNRNARIFRTLGYCVCGRTPSEGHTRCEACAARQRAYKKAWRARKKGQMQNGSICVRE